MEVPDAEGEEMSRRAEGVQLEVKIPKGKFDGKSFDFFLDANDIAYFQTVPGNYKFASMTQRMFASRIWQTLTGSAVLGRYLNLS